MCYHVTEQLKLELIQERFGRQAINRELFEQAYHLNSFAQPYLPAISTHDNKMIDMYRWKLIPYWVKKETDWKANTLHWNLLIFGCSRNYTHLETQQKKVTILNCGLFY